MKKTLTAILSFAALLSTYAHAQTVQTVASFSVLADIAKQVGGEHIQVSTLVGPDGDPHTFEPTAKDSVTLSQADLVFVSGLGLEGWMGRLISASGYQGMVITASKGISTRKMEEDGETITDPHAWNSAKNAEVYARNIMEALIKTEPQYADYFRANGEAYIAQLDALDQWANTQFNTIQKSKRKVLTSHDAFGYFGEAYGVKFLSPVGFSTESEASASGVAKLIDQMKTEKIHCYFIENQTNPRLVKQIASATGATAGGELYPEALTHANGNAPTYIDAFKHNVITMVNSMK
ncbi:metal ABC transporter substrate-binding protein [Vibrio mediterranei]